jgi:hypothetical protein
MSIESIPKFTPPAAKLWDAIPAGTRKSILANVWCGKCSHGVTITNFSGAVKGGDLLLSGSCSECQGPVARLIELDGSTRVEALRNFLQSLQAGSLSEEVESQMMPLLTGAWNSIEGTGAQSTFAYKLDRAEKLEWNPPVLSFTMERHGGTVNLSTRAFLHHWKVDIEKGVAHIAKTGARQLYPMAPRLDVKGLATEVRKRIVAGERLDSLKWISDSHVVIQIGSIIPEAHAQTTSSRRKRFRAALDQEMAEAGWQKADQGNRCGYMKKGPTDEK